MPSCTIQAVNPISLPLPVHKEVIKQPADEEIWTEKEDLALIGTLLDDEEFIYGSAPDDGEWNTLHWSSIASAIPGKTKSREQCEARFSELKDDALSRDGNDNGCEAEYKPGDGLRSRFRDRVKASAVGYRSSARWYTDVESARYALTRTPIA